MKCNIKMSKIPGPCLVVWQSKWLKLIISKHCIYDKIKILRPAYISGQTISSKGLRYKNPFWFTRGSYVIRIKQKNSRKT